jgi:hypothetical protein
VVLMDMVCISNRRQIGQACRPHNALTLEQF